MSGQPQRPFDSRLRRLWAWITGHWLRVSALAFGLIVTLGTVGFMLTAGLNLIDGLYMAVITLSTVGYENLATSAGGRLFTAIYIILGVGVATATISAMAAAMVEGRIRDVLGRRRMQRQIEDLKDHVIVCGYGRFGQLVSRDLEKGGMPFVVIEHEPEVAAQAEALGYLALATDATEEESLQRAGIETAHALICTLPSDAENVYTILSARDVRPDPETFTIAAIARDRRAQRKLRVAGANHAISPWAIGSQTIARQILTPHLARVMRLATQAASPPEDAAGLEKAGVGMAEMHVGTTSALVGVALKDSPVRRDYGVILISVIQAADQQPVFNPGRDYVVQADDVLIAVGPVEGLRRLRAAATSVVPDPGPA